LGTTHHEFHFTVEEGIDAVADVVYHLDSFEQIRAATPMFLLSRKIKALGIKMVLSGEGADEMFGGYLYFHRAPSADAFFAETVRKTTRLHLWDVNRANKSAMAWGVEARVPYLDKTFLDMVMNIDAAEKMINLSEVRDEVGGHVNMEKYLLRKAFDDPSDPYLPDSILWRQKEQFSDGVGYSWVDGLEDHAAKVVTDEMWDRRDDLFPSGCVPPNKEYFFLQSIFQKCFPGMHALQTVPRGRSIACSTPEAVGWVDAWSEMNDISGRAIAGIHEAARDIEIAPTPTASSSEDTMGGVAVKKQRPSESSAPV